MREIKDYFEQLDVEKSLSDSNSSRKRKSENDVFGDDDKSS